MTIEHNVISYSGGKDSTAMLLLAIEQQAENLQAVFADTGNEHPSTYEYVRYVEQATGVPIRWIRADFSKQIEGRRQMMRNVIAGTHKNQGRYEWTPEIAEQALGLLYTTGNPFLDMCMVHGRFPSTKVAFCSKELKRDQLTKQVHLPLLDAGDDVRSWQGVRADEGAKRALLPASEHVLTRSSGAELWNYRPILPWTADECFEMHRKHGLKSNPLYELGMRRVGCMPCINAGKDELLEISKRFPEELERLAVWEQLISKVSKTKVATFFPASDLGATSAADAGTISHGIHARVEWAKTSRGGRQYDLMRVDPEVELCSSIYGLCE
ncbi:phosphoadenosine phosphosulfate reductase family protein [Pseudomonas fluorescens]|uniref:phosphoadenosine phosphosulfate reductase family protein n=1 Tax=Pseudomonas fluorescens TaxID=294 RepID=UPI00285A77E7|nr:phosphoadenosine phosphosulfate reductase family protein [Pseudomonas fluorescens]MDR6162372.1 3'-phosphoadenosine 5'-phosphosulfate sulfotransferase (PAPS reductase)/FAD synthetase [Pseudomonas fluorescens]